MHVLLDSGRIRGINGNGDDPGSKTGDEDEDEINGRRIYEHHALVVPDFASLSQLHSDFICPSI